jgi:hypothetical protein
MPPTARHSSGTIGQLVADVPSGLSLTPPQKQKQKKTTYTYSSYVLDRSSHGDDEEYYHPGCDSV